MQKKELSRRWKVIIWLAVAVLSAALRGLSIPFYLNGSLTMEVHFDGALLAMVAAICGPLYGALACMEADALGYILRPDGVYVIGFTLVAAAKGAAAGFIWRLARRVRTERLGIGLLTGFGVALALGALNTIVFGNIDAEAFSRWVSPIGVDGGYLSIGLIIGGWLGLATCVVAYIAHQWVPKLTREYYYALCALLIPELLATAVNTRLIDVYVLPDPAPFLTLLAPRLARDLLLCAINAYLLVFLMWAAKQVFEINES